MYVWNVSIKDTFYMNNSGLIDVAININLHSPVRETAEIVETSIAFR